ncbi:carbamoyltransferase HypF [Motiliproteus sp. SC1-56]|uniref:carbamoyltransferase HypF n=1 Tax=Motiliproteus sp. SC1-56 TaxID=2799565 RepID=UPI001A8D3D51|nr:carbamoyltransferase HypF [Motiliproteus sp. SC1-56]
MDQLQGRHLRVTGQVQGVGFRPFVYNLARRLGLSGQVSNDAGGVRIDLFGAEALLERFERALREEAPPLARIEAIHRAPLSSPLAGDGFRILGSGGGEVAVGVAPDAAVCEDCLAELFDPQDRRYRYPFINCTNCGPRYSLITGLPYDRCRTTMAAFSLCLHCSDEYRTPGDRRFHAQPTACPDCGPQLSLHDEAGQALEVSDPLVEALNRLQAGDILAIKGVGGFHLVCDARNSDAVARLRTRKRRDEKPFAVMGANRASLAEVVTLDAPAIDHLESAVAPIVLCPARPGRALTGVAPGLSRYGVMLPHAPLHYLLFHQAAGQPAGTAWLAEPQALLLVMTSANPSGEPLVTDNQEALIRLQGLVDGFLLHDRDIRIRCDDSVVHAGHRPPALVRRGRGMAPQVIHLGRSGPSTLAVGGLFKNTLCLTKGSRAYVSQHIGDLDNPRNCRALTDTLAHLCELLEIEPERVAMDRHPDFFSSRFAREYAAERRLPLIEVQHHHAHIAAVVAEHRIEAPVLGLALDGLGLGDDGRLWGGELLRVDSRGFKRLGHLSALPLPGGDRAAREPWRIAAGVLHRLGRSREIEARFAERDGAGILTQMLARNLNCPETTSAGRLFDAAAALLGVKEEARFEAQPAMMLEALAEAQGEVSPEPLLIRLTDDGGLDTWGLLARLLELGPERAGYGAALFHDQLVRGLAAWLVRHRRASGLDTLVLGGGCFLNALLSNGLSQHLGQQGLRVLRAEQIPCNDGGLSLGQAWVALNTD